MVLLKSALNIEISIGDIVSNIITIIKYRIFELIPDGSSIQVEKTLHF